MDISFDNEKGVAKELSLPDVPQEPYVAPSALQTIGASTYLTQGKLNSAKYVSSTQGWSLDSEGGATHYDITVGTRTVVVTDAGQIQSAIDKLHDDGGGVVALKNATYLMTDNITLYSNVYLYGENRDRTIIDFQDNTKGVVIKGSGAYSTGTVSVSSAGTTVTGSGTSWSSNVTVGQEILLGGTWYPVTAVGSDTSITIGLNYAGTALSGASYVVATTISDVNIKNLYIENANVAIDTRYGKDVILDNIIGVTSVTGFQSKDSANGEMRDVRAVACSAGFNFDNAHTTIFYTIASFDAASGNGITAANSTDLAFIYTEILGSSGDGMNLTSCSNVAISATIQANGGQGIEFVSGNDSVTINDSAVQGNASDGIKLTATSDNCLISNSSITGNGGYGVNIAASTCDNTRITSNIFNTNSSGNSSDSGTGTLFRGNIGVNDNAVSSSPITELTKTFTAAEAISQYDAVSITDGTESGTAISQTSDNGYINIEYSSDNLDEGSGDLLGVKVAQSFSLTYAAILASVNLKLMKQGSPTGTLTVALQADSGGAPSGVNLASATKAESSLTTSPTVYTFTFGTPYTISASTTYWIVISGSTAVNTTNNSIVRFQKSDAYTGGAIKIYRNTNVWASPVQSTHDLYFVITKTYSAGQVLQASSASANSREKNFIGFATDAIASGATGTVAVAGAATLSGLSAGSLYYLNDTQGTIGTTAGSVSRKVGIALSTTQLLVTNIW